MFCHADLKILYRDLFIFSFEERHRHQNKPAGMDYHINSSSSYGESTTSIRLQLRDRDRRYWNKSFLLSRRILRRIVSSLCSWSFLKWSQTFLCWFNRTKGFTSYKPTILVIDWTKGFTTTSYHQSILVNQLNQWFLLHISRLF
jgi:hypothetical protein